MKKVLLLYITEYGGHSKAANNIKEALAYRDPSIRMLSRNALGYFYPRGSKVVDFIYNTVIKHFPQLWGRMYDRRSVIRNLAPLHKIVNRFSFGKLSRLLHSFPPDCIVTTQAFPCGVVADFKNKYGVKIPLIAVVTDYHPHRFWIHPQVDRYVVACNEARHVLISEGVAAEKIKVLGIPISVQFMVTAPKKEVAKRYGLLPGMPAVLLMGGGLGIGPIEDIARKLDALPLDFQIITVCGRNKRLFRWFKRHHKEFQKPLFYYSYVDYVRELMDFADIIITKSGGITVSEALAKGMAMIVANPIPGQEELNIKYLQRREAAIRADEPEEVAEAVKNLLGNPKKLYGLRENAKSLSYIDASLRIADLVREMVI